MLLHNQGDITNNMTILITQIEIILYCRIIFLIDETSSLLTLEKCLIIKARSAKFSVDLFLDSIRRRVAAMSLAKRVANETQTELGSLVGYR